MSRRFGRNQKRAMRNKIQNQEKLLEHHVEIISSLNWDIRQANNIVNRTADILGEHFASLPAKTTEVKEILPRYRHFTPHQASYASGPINTAAIFVDNALDYIDTYQAALSIDDLRKTMHMRYISHSGSVGYGLSETSWRKLSEDQLIALLREQIAGDMATHLVRQRKKAMM